MTSETTTTCNELPSTHQHFKRLPGFWGKTMSNHIFNDDTMDST